MKLTTPMMGIALYDYAPDKVDMKKFFELMEDFALKVDIPWGSMGLGERLKLMTFKGGKRKLEKDPSGLQAYSSLNLLGGVSETGSNLDWQTSAHLSKRERDELCLCFEKRLLEENVISIPSLLRDLLACADFKYGIVYERLYKYMPDAYASGGLGCIGKSDLSDEDEDKIWAWTKKHRLNPHYYHTGLLRDVYPYNIFVDAHLGQKVGGQTLKEWILSDPTHGTLEKLTDQHSLWSIAPNHIPMAQEVLQEAGLLLCYQV